LQEAEARGHEVLVAEGVETGGPKRGEYHRAKFVYDEEREEVICPQGQRLRFEGEKNKGGQRTVRSYRCQHYEQCPVRALCSRRRDGRRIEISPQYGALLRQRAKRRDPAQRALIRQRSGLIEPVFATIKQAMGFRRWTVRGLENVRTQWALLCAVFNLKKMYKYWAAKRWCGRLKGLCRAWAVWGSQRIVTLSTPGVGEFVIGPSAVTAARIHA
jgi:hypothetical protein